MKNVAIIRDRGQLTIPDDIRKAVPWVAPSSVVTISIIKPDEIVIKPHQQKIDEDKIWELIQASRAIKGRGKGSAVSFLKKDRD